MNICIPTCRRPEMAARLIDSLEEAWLFINNCDEGAYDHIKARKTYLPICGDPVQCSNDVFSAIIHFAPDNEDLLIIEDDTVPCKNFVAELMDRWIAIEDTGINKYTINPLYTPARITHYTPRRDYRISYKDGKYSFINQNWVDTNLFIPAALLPEFKEWYKTPPPIAKKSNGIGRYHSRKMYEAGYPMFTCVPSLLGHGDHDSIIYPEGRKRVPLIAKI